ncbi:MAG: diaminopimelate decarboxylase [Cyanobacteria bacterium TGS_CYA1]|nr:diaminopimelate decarboxylase [Cyanobacteria bacterium TGS_CYA1]
MIKSPNTRIWPHSATINKLDHLEIAGLDVCDLAKKYGTPLWLMDYASIFQANEACKRGLEHYPGEKTILYAGKAFLCLAMCKIINQLDMGLDVVSLGEFKTALQANVKTQNIFLHGNNKSLKELELAIELEQCKIVVDNMSELTLALSISKSKQKKARILLRIKPGIEPDTHDHIKTGQETSKFGIGLNEINEYLSFINANDENLDFLGFHAHIGSQALELDVFEDSIKVLGDLSLKTQSVHGLKTRLLDVGGGLGITYIEQDKPPGLYEWSLTIARSVQETYQKLGLDLPHLMIEPGRSIVGTAGVTIYEVGHVKRLANNSLCLAVDGGMADNPRPSTYDAKYTAKIANAMSSESAEKVSIVGKYCESGDIIVKDAGIEAGTGDLIAVFGTGAYNYSMSSNYNRTGRPACLLLKDGQADLILERETIDDLIRQDRVPAWLARER